MAQIPSSILRILRPMNYYRFCLWRVKLLQILVYSKISNQKLANSGQKGVFLDCGSNLGQGFEFFRRYYPNDNYDYMLFEPNPYCFQVLIEKYSDLKKSGVQVRNVAVGIQDGSIDFYGLEEAKGGIHSVGGTVLPEHNSKKYGPAGTPSLKVQCINFLDFLVDMFETKEYPVIILKLDIEGGEYSILDALMSRNLLHNFDSIYIEFHSQYMSGKFASSYIKKEKEFLEYSRRHGIRVVKWI